MKTSTGKIVIVIMIYFLGGYGIGSVVGYFAAKPAQTKSNKLQLELALAKTENRVLTQKLAACQNPPVEREPKPILNF